MAKIGVIGGLGVYAGLDFCRRLTASGIPEYVLFSTSKHDLEKDKANSILVKNYLEEATNSLVKAGCSKIIICCNTAHAHLNSLEPYFTPDLFLSLVDGAKHLSPEDGSVAILCTPSARRHVYEELFPASFAKTSESFNLEVQTISSLVKIGEFSKAKLRLDSLIKQLTAIGFHKYLIACTELSFFFETLNLEKEIVIFDTVEFAIHQITELT